MQAKVTLLRTRGIRRSRSEIEADPGTAGELTLTDCAGENHHYRRAVRVANLLTPRGVSSTPVNALVPLIEPVITRINARSFLLVGFETEVQSGGAHAEHAQGWLVRL